MDDNTVSDQGTFVSVDNFLETSRRDSVPSPPPPPPPQSAPHFQFQASSSAARDSNFMWTLFQEEAEVNANATEELEPVPSGSHRVNHATPSNQNSAPADQHLTSSDRTSRNHPSRVLQEDDAFSDADDMCLNLDSQTNNRQQAAASSAEWIQSTAPHPAEDFPQPRDQNPSPHSIEGTNANVNTQPDFINAFSGNALNESTTDVAQTPAADRDLADNLEDTLGTPNVDDVIRQLSIRNQDRLQEGAEGFTSCQVSNPFTEHLAVDNKVTLYSSDGPLTSDELSFLQQMGTISTSVESRLLSKMFATIVFQRDQLSNLEDTAVILSNDAMRSAEQQFGEVERRRSLAMTALIRELDVERDRSYDIETKYQDLRDRLEFSENRLNAVEDFCKRLNPSFSFERGVEEALKEILEDENPRRESAEDVVDRNAEMEALSRRLLHLDAALSESTKRSNEVQAENAMLKTKLVALEEGIDDSNMELSPEVQKKLSPIRDAVADERDELASICQQQKDQIDTLHKFLETSAEEKKKVNDAFLSLNVDMEMARTKIDTLQKQRDSAEREWREIEKLRSSERRTYHDMCNELSQNIVSAVNDLNSSESKVHLLTQEVEDRETVISSLRVTVNELEEQLNALTDAAITRANKSQTGSHDDSEQISVVIDTVIANLRGELERSQALLEEKSQQLSEIKKRVAVQDEVAQSLRRECDRYRSIADARGSNSPSRRASSRVFAEDQQNMFLQRLSEKLGIQSATGHEVVGKLISRVEDLLKERTEYETTSVKLRNDVLERERTLHVVKSEMQAENSTLKAELQHLENMKNRALEQCKFAEDKVLELLGEKDLTKADSMGDITITSAGTRRQSGLSDLDNFSRRDSMISSLGADHSIQWNDPLVAAAIQSLSNLTEMKDKIGARYRALRERLDRMIRRGEVDPSGVDAKALMIESREIQDDLSGVLNMQQDIIETLRPRAPSDIMADESNADNTLPYVGSHDIWDGANYTAGLVEHRRGGPAPVLMNVAGDDLNEATGFLRDQLKQTRDLYNEKSRANAQLCGAVAELKQELEHMTNGKRSAEDFLTQVTQNHTSFISRLGRITGTDASMVAIEDFVQKSIQDVASLSAEFSAKEVQTKSLVRRLTKLGAQKHILSHMVYTYQSKYHLDLLMPSAEEKKSVGRLFRTRVFALLASIKMRKSISTSEKSGLVEEIDITGIYDLPTFAPIGRQRTDGPSLVNASVAIAAVPRLEAALMDRDRQITDLRSAISALDNNGLPTIPEDIRNSLQTSFAYDEDILARKQDLARRLRRAVKEKGEVEDRLSREKETRIALEAKLSRYSERLATAKRRLGKMNSQADSKERTYKAAIKYLKQKADKAVENDCSIDENTDPWSTPVQLRRKDAGEKSGEQVANAKSLSILQAQIERAEGDLKKTEQGSAEYEEIVKYIQGLHKAVQRLRQTRKPVPQAPMVVNSNLAA